MSKDKLRSYVTYTYSEGCLFVNFRRTPLIKVSGKDRKEAFDYVKKNQDKILDVVAKEVVRKRLVA